MSRLAGRNGRVLLAITSGGVAQAVSFQNAWTLNQVTNKIDVTAMGDSTKIYVPGLADASGTFSGWFDDATAQSYTAATDGIARAFYLYPNFANTGQYWWGTVYPDFSLDSSVDGAVAVSASWAAATPILKVG